jgi:AraC family cel operon transcriptional repressor
MGQTPGRYLNTLHLSYAANLLNHTNRAIIDIAFDSGYDSLSYFYHQFKKEFSVSPLKYREQCQEDPSLLRA